MSPPGVMSDTNTSTNGDAAETVIVSARAPTLISESTLAVNPTVNRTPSRRTL